MLKRLALAATLALAALPASADDRTVVTAFYQQVLSAPAAPDLADRTSRILAPGWQSIGDFVGPAKTREQFTAQMAGIGKVVPNLTWQMVDVLQQGNRYVVIGRGTGTPVAAFFGVPPSGKSFDILTIDVHTVEGGQITRSYHVEDWMSALRQLRAQ